MSPGFTAAATGPRGPADPPFARSPLVVLSIKDVSPRGFRKDGMTFAAERCRCGDLFTGARMQPVAPIEPPASLPLLGGGEESIGPRRIDRSDHEGRFRVGRWIEQALQMAAVREHEGGVFAQDLSRLVNALPRRDVVGHARDDIGVRGDFAHVDGLFVQRELAGIGERIGEIEIEVSRRAGEPEGGSYRRSSKEYRTPAAGCRADSYSPSNSRSGHWAASRQTSVLDRGHRQSRADGMSLWPRASSQV